MGHGQGRQAAAESYLIVSVVGRDDSVGSIDYYIFYRNEDDTWSAPGHPSCTVRRDAWQSESHADMLKFCCF